MKTLKPEEFNLLRECLTSCSDDEPEAIATDEQCRIIRELWERGLVVPCHCDGHEFPHAKITSLGMTALECARALEKTG
jgi:hypothetical protein